MPLIPHRLLLVSALLWATLPASFAWAPETRVRMVDEAVRFMPPSLRIALDKHREALRRGMLTPMLDEGSPDHRPPWAGGRLDRSIEQAAAALDAALSAPRPRFSDVAERFGTLAHFVLDAGFPPGMSAAGGGSRYAHFAKLCETRREKFPLVFYGHDAAGTGDAAWLGATALATMQRAREEDRELARAYAAAGRPPDPSAFDDRSVPFAVASLSYSRGITDLVRIWLAVWSRNGGDTGRTPYMDRRDRR